jgi:hypothetical protein
VLGREARAAEGDEQREPRDEVLADCREGAIEHGLLQKTY